MGSDVIFNSPYLDRDLLQSTLLGRGMFIHIDGHSLDDVCRDELSVEHDLREPPSLHSLAFRATIFSQFRHSEPPLLLNLGVQSHYLFSVWAFRATTSSQFGRLEPPSLLSLGVQSHYLFAAWRSKPPYLLCYDV
ncbi:hypothetical protein VitviT2T_005107 [Vitis vinifera]|uniref:Uncharacterized protein n=1 Tax=Vitis vinifera TaxID=29760 RepID=A0ABY9BRW3_VITVI|nr:hypothetical protein VitviT2T_005107 [Vitis vinifera]